MRSAVHKDHRRNGAVAGHWRIAILACFGGLALAAFTLPFGFDDSGLVLNRATAASANSADGNRKGPQSAPGQQQQEDLVDSEDVRNNDAEAARPESNQLADERTIVPIAEGEPANTNVIKEIAGLAGDTELSEEEEREAIQSGWGTWRTADGPDTVTAQ